MSYYRFGELFGREGVGMDRVRNAQVPTTDIQLDTLEEAYSTEHMIVRIYKVKPLDNLGRAMVRKQSSTSGVGGKSAVKDKPKRVPGARKQK